MAKKEDKTYGGLAEDDYAFFAGAYKHNKKAREDINRVMKSRGMTEEEVAKFFNQRSKVRNA